MTTSTNEAPVCGICKGDKDLLPCPIEITVGEVLGDKVAMVYLGASVCSKADNICRTCLKNTVTYL